MKRFQRCMSLLLIACLCLPVMALANNAELPYGILDVPEQTDETLLRIPFFGEPGVTYALYQKYRSIWQQPVLETLLSTEGAFTITLGSGRNDFVLREEGQPRDAMGGVSFIVTLNAPYEEAHMLTDLISLNTRLPLDTGTPIVKQLTDEGFPVLSSFTGVEPTPEPTPSPIPSPSPTSSPTPDPSPTSSPTPSPSPSPTPSPSPIPSPSPSPTPSPSPSPTPSPSPSPTPSPSPSPTPSPSPSPTPSPSPIPEPTPSPSPTPEPTPSPEPTPAPLPEATGLIKMGLQGMRQPTGGSTPLSVLFPAAMEAAANQNLITDQVSVTAKEPKGAQVPITTIVPYTPPEATPAQQGSEESIGGLEDTGESEGTKGIIPEATELPTDVAPIDQGVQRTLRLWAKGNDVRMLQRQLTALGFKTGKADGVYGTKTYGAVKRFQKAYGLKQDGIVGTETRLRLQELGVEIPLYYNYEAQFPEGFTRKLSIGLEGADVRLLQTELINQGYLEGYADEVFGKKTRTAVRKFQRAHELMVDGVAGVDTIRLLLYGDALRPESLDIDTK